MSSSPSRTLAPPDSTGRGSASAVAERPEALPFRYREAPRHAMGAEDAKLGRAAGDATYRAGEAGQAEAEARESGRQQGERDARAKFDEQLGRERARIAQALEDFAGERAAYFRKIEREAVQLALSIARKVLYREAQVDANLLMGVVRVALDRMEGATAVSLAVHPQNAEPWRLFFATQKDGGSVREIIADPAIGKDRCELRTAMGTAQLGIELQLKEIEQGLMDLMAARPGGNKNS